MNILNADVYRRYYPDMPNEVPTVMLDDRHAAVTQGKTLKRLEEEGGMSVSEIALNLDRELDYNKRKGDEEAIETIKKALTTYERLSALQEKENLTGKS